jgi:hypothetical protein
VAIDTETYSAKLREVSINLEKRQILIARLQNSEQEVDLTTSTNCNGYGRIHHFKLSNTERWSDNPLPILPAAKALNYLPGDMVRAQVFQNASCNWRCWYCFVPYKLLEGSTKHGTFFTAEDLIDMYLEIAVDERPRIIDLSGGQPDLVPEWTVWMMEALIEKGLEKEVFLWADDNLSNKYFWQYLSQKQIEFMAGYSNYARVIMLVWGVLKGTMVGPLLSTHLPHLIYLTNNLRFSNAYLRKVLIYTHTQPLQPLCIRESILRFQILWIVFNKFTIIFPSELFH